MNDVSFEVLQGSRRISQPPTVELQAELDFDGIINESKKETTNLLSYFFCQGTDSRINNATAVLRSLIYLIVAQQPSLIPQVRKKYDYVGKGLFEDVNASLCLPRRQQVRKSALDIAGHYSAFS
ncbi:hypothetical protein B0J13DRAFT_621717 [Dactylonectria estremocensis]|uniref:Nephrocystin 3-like N-terminal domain-containing protein n=1 Tax=Dactylonectria estremocensis TaxID=1079267 RepID=A0A9P9ETQ5_9HYPO|nr:hypothetical protein B0J13DRAFT_621717 [Dactylonectria estremocensis]